MTKRKTGSVTLYFEDGETFTVKAGDLIEVNLRPGDGNSLSEALYAGEGETLSILPASFTVELDTAEMRFGAGFLLMCPAWTLPWWPREGEA